MSMPLQDESGLKDIGRLANNGMAVKALQSSLGRAETNLSVIPRLMSRVIREDAWRHWVDADHGEFRAKDFRLFLTSPKPAGCGTPLHVIERALKDTDVWEAFIELCRGEPGGANNPHGRTGKPEEIKCDNVILDLEPQILPIPSKPATGNSTSYSVRRLRKERPDLLDRVKSGDLSAHAAMVQAGFRDKAITIPADPAKAAKRLLVHFRGEQLEALIWALSEGLKS